MAVPKMRNLRPRIEDSVEDTDMDESAEEELIDEEKEDEGGDSPSEAENGVDNAAVEAKLSNISFGALRQAQESLSRKRKRGSDTTPNQDDKLEALRERLRQIKEEKAAASRHSSRPKRKSDDRQGGSDNEEDSESDSAPSEEDAATKSRTSKHAPGAQSTRHQVSRKRVVVDVPKRIVRDPRFDALQKHNVPNGNSEKAYSFLRDYQKAEMDELRAAIKRTKNEDDKDVLRRKLGSMENKLKAKDAKDREQEIIRRHRKEERQKIQQGKNPYYLKKKDVKEQALVEKFKGMKSKDREKLIEKRRKKEGQKEKKRMPDARRMVG